MTTQPSLCPGLWLLADEKQISGLFPFCHLCVFVFLSEAYGNLMLPSLVWRGVTLASLRRNLWVSVTDSGIKVCGHEDTGACLPVSNCRVPAASPVQPGSLCFSALFPHCPSSSDSEGETRC